MFGPSGVLSAAPGHESTPILVWPLALALAAVHVLAPGRTVLDSIPHRALVSFGSGVSVAYVFVHLLPEVSSVGEVVLGGDFLLLPVHISVYLLALAGFVTFYGLDQALRESKSPSEEDGGTPAGTSGPGGVFWLHLGSFAWYNAILGYVLVERMGEDRFGLLLFGIAIGLHLFVNDNGLREHYERRYHQYGRWLLATTILLGVWFAVTVPVHESHVGVLRAFVAGAIVFNVIKEELPGHRESRFSMFAAGVVLYTALLAVT